MTHERTAEHDATVAARGCSCELRTIIRQDVNMLEQNAGLLAQVINVSAQFAAGKLVYSLRAHFKYSLFHQQPTEVTGSRISCCPQRFSSESIESQNREEQRHHRERCRRNRMPDEISWRPFNFRHEPVDVSRGQVTQEYRRQRRHKIKRDVNDVGRVSLIGTQQIEDELSDA